MYVKAFCSINLGNEHVQNNGKEVIGLVNW